MNYFDCTEKKNINFKINKVSDPILVGASLDVNGQTYYEFRKAITEKYTCVIAADSGVVRYLNEDASTISPSIGERVFGVDDYPAELMFDGTWKYNFDTGEFFQDADIVAANTLAANTATYNALLRACTDAAFPLQSVIALGIATEEQLATLAELQQYAADLINPDIVDLTKSPLQLPAAPVALSVK